MAFEMKYVISTPLSLAKDIHRFYICQLSSMPDSGRKEIFRNILLKEFSMNFSEEETKEILCKCDTLAELTIAIFFFERRLQAHNCHYRRSVALSVLEYFRQKVPQEYDRTIKKVKSFSKRSGTA
ncbi:MAG: hypothetical protein FIA94_05785 [Nitrospirae bacterium]|nr:hypothetical protein [Nitrospirota bacterium]